jgi:phosphoserine phosphatase
VRKSADNQRQTHTSQCYDRANPAPVIKVRFYQGGLINRRAVLKTAYAQFVYLVGGADHDQMERMRQYLSALCTGWDVGQVKEIVAETLHDLIDPLIYQEAADLIAEHKAAGRDVIIVSSRHGW